MSIKVLIVDDHEMVRDGLSVMMEREEDFTVVGEAQNGLEAVEKTKALNPDVVLMDLRMPDMDGVEAMRQIRAVQDDVKFLVLTTYDSDEYIFDAIEAGAKGYLFKDTSREELFRAVRTVNRGESLIDPAVVSRLLDRLTELSHRAAHGPEHGALSEREVEVLQLMARGSANKQIASDLSITESTVKTHVANIFQKLEVSHRTEAVTKAISQGIIKL
ncbi:MAG TPA: response regulator transcription factor [Dehalococcoidia bacterium]|nr:response regulator transcription factor [Dehalococcoidia bacterium]